MRTLVIEAGRELGLRDLPEPVPGPGDVRLDVAYSGICGSDLHLIYDIDPAATGLVLGHEISGSVGEVGQGLKGWRPGDRVAVLPIDRCGSCSACLQPDGVCLVGLTRGPGLGRQGGFAESVVVPADMLVALPDAVDDRAGAIAEPLAVAVRAVRRSEIAPGSSVCVLGAGPIGLFVMSVLHARGVEDVVLSEPNESRRTLAEEVHPGVRLGTSTKDAVGGRRVDVVIDCTGNAAAAPSALEHLRFGGRLMIVGMPPKPSMLSLTQAATSEIVLTGSLAYNRDDFAAAVALLADGDLPVDRLVTGVEPLENADAVVRELHSGTSTHVKVLLAARA